MSKVLVLGAGASHAYGYPLGWGLRRKILSLSPYETIGSGILTQWGAQHPNNQLVAFQSAFKESQMYSIDAFLARRSEFSEIGKKCIAHILLSCEQLDSLFNEDGERDHWYQYLLNHYVQVDWDELDFSDLSIVTFNYDRSLEHYFLYALQAIYGKAREEVIEKLKTLRIVHVYGVLGSTYPDNTDRYRPYDKSMVDPHWINIAASSIHVIPEGRVANAAELEAARGLLENASGICFLGFGFDKLNVERLAENGACRITMKNSSGIRIRNMTGTSLGMTSAESNSAWRKLITDQDHHLREVGFKQLNCTQLLRETLFLG